MPLAASTQAKPSVATLVDVHDDPHDTSFLPETTSHLPLAHWELLVQKQPSPAAEHTPLPSSHPPLVQVCADTHVAPTQVVLPVQGAPQPPQLALSVRSSTQAPLQGL
jgi:hypothetical protein